MNTLQVALATLATMLLNIPFGYWRGEAKRRGSRLEWVAAIHLPVPAVALMRRFVGLTLSLKYIPVLALFVAAYFTGQRIGSTIENLVHRETGKQTRCIYVGLQTLLARRRGLTGPQGLSESS